MNLWEGAQSERTGSRFFAADLLHTLTTRLAELNSCLLTLEQQHELVGFAFFSPARNNSGAGDVIPSMAHISSVAVNPTHWGQGLGRRLMIAVIDELSGFGYANAQLWTQPSNSRALSLYLSLGFQFTGDEKVFDGELIRRYVGW
ncbi:MAG: GNAT family N-acetyltransferase [Candidatus Eremiobacteraeota bacterium]|nr:GNAT family N-acetyltransferase [Candidatus Eremiobacteraeota bacterium]